MIAVDGDVMRAIAPHFSGSNRVNQKRIIDAVGEVLEATLAKYEINTRLRIAHFLAQTCEELAGFRTTVEFASGAEYEGRADLGNTKKGDGPRYKGRGLIQLTGRANYKRYGEALGLKLVDNPELAAEPATSLLIACEYWDQNNLNDLADGDNLVAITKRINGGVNGIEVRRGFLTAAKAALARLEAPAIAPADPAAMPGLRRGSKGEMVATLQARLRAAGFPVAIDADFGPATELAVMRFEAAHNQTADGIVGPETWVKLPQAAAADQE